MPLVLHLITLHKELYIHNYGNHQPHNPYNSHWYSILFLITAFAVGTTNVQKDAAAQIGGIANAMPTPHNNMRAGVMFFLIKLSIG